MGENMQSKNRDNDMMGLLMNIESRLSRLEAKIEDIEGEIVEIKEELRRRNGYMKYTIIILIIILSFISAMFGLGWRPPHP